LNRTFISLAEDLFILDPLELDEELLLLEEDEEDDELELLLDDFEELLSDLPMIV